MTGRCPCPIYYRGVVSVEKESVIIRSKLAELIKKLPSRGTRPREAMFQACHMVGSRTMLSRSHVSSVTGGCTCPISYRGVVSIEKESMIIRYKLAELIKRFLSRGTRPREAMFQSCHMVGSRTMLARSHVSSMTGGCTCPIAFRGVVSIEKASMIIRYQLAELIKKVLRPQPFSRSQVSSMPMVGRRTMPSRSHVSSTTGGCTCLIYHQGIVGLQKGSVIIR